jgi:K+-transporting ATPase ATPase C chain
MLRQLRAMTVMFALLTLLTGVIYPLIVTGIGRLAFASQISGSVIENAGKAVGSALLGQPFTSSKYFWSRPSGTSPQGYNADSSSGSNLGPTNSALTDAVTARIKALRVADAGNTRPVPVDLVTASASGLDPEISPAAAEYQIGRVARARGLPEQTVRELVTRYTAGRTLGVLGEPRVNVLKLNLALDMSR